MTLVERFIEFNQWPTSRKSALLYGLALPAHVLFTIVGYFTLSDMHWVDRDLVVHVYWYWNAQILASFLISLVAAMRGVEGRWTIWLNVIPYGLFILISVAMFGMATSAFSVWFPSIIVLVMVWYDLRAGFYAFMYGLFLISSWTGLTAMKLIPFAPAVLDRSIDAQNNPLWALYVFSNVLSYFAFCFLLVLLLISAQQLQQRRLAEAQRKLDRSNRLISRYIPSQLATRIIEGDHSEMIKPERVKLTIFFSDIEGFTDASDRLDAEELASLLDEYLSEMTTIAERYKATIGQFVGDGMMIFFGAPEATNDNDHALRAVRMALDMQQRLLELQDTWHRRGIERPFRARIGINTGHASVGDYGSSGRKLYTAIGMQTNLAARIQSHCEPGKVLISHTTWALVRNAVVHTDMGQLQLKGLHAPMRVYEISGLADDNVAVA